jgi:hypothetical protein
VASLGVGEDDSVDACHLLGYVKCNVVVVALEYLVVVCAHGDVVRHRKACARLPTIEADVIEGHNRDVLHANLEVGVLNNKGVALLWNLKLAGHALDVDCLALARITIRDVAILIDMEALDVVALEQLAKALIVEISQG